MRYAPELHIIGVIATGLVVDFSTKPGAAHPPLPVDYSDPAQMDAAYAMAKVEGADHSLHPDLDTRSAMTPAGVSLSHVARTVCLIDLFRKAKTDGTMSKDLFTTDLARLQPDEAEASSIPDGRIEIPIFAGTGLADYEASLPGQNVKHPMPRDAPGGSLFGGDVLGSDRRARDTLCCCAPIEVAGAAITVPVVDRAGSVILISRRDPTSRNMGAEDGNA